jgi:LysM domain
VRYNTIGSSFDRTLIRSNKSTIELPFVARRLAVGNPSAAEAKLDARIRPEITVLRSVTPYPRRHRPAPSVLDGGVLDGGVDDGQAGELPAAASAAHAQADVAKAMMPAADLSRWIRPPAASAAPAGVGRPARPTALQAPAAASPVRLTKRGKIVLGLLALAMVASATVLIWLAIAGHAQAAQKAGPGTAGSQGMLRVVVHPGQTLWSIAVRTDPAADPRVVIQQIIDDNALAGTAIQAGQVLWVPRL